MRPLTTLSPSWLSPSARELSPGPGLSLSPRYLPLSPTFPALLGSTLHNIPRYQPKITCQDRSGPGPHLTCGDSEGPSSLAAPFHPRCLPRRSLMDTSGAADIPLAADSSIARRLANQGLVGRSAIYQSQLFKATTQLPSGAGPWRELLAPSGWSKKLVAVARHCLCCQSIEAFRRLWAPGLVQQQIVAVRGCNIAWSGSVCCLRGQGTDTMDR